MGGSADGIGERRFAFTAGLGAALLAAAVVADFVFRAFWNKHGLLTSLLASLLVVAVTVAALNELLKRRDRKRRSIVAQSALFALIESASLTWTVMVEVLES